MAVIKFTNSTGSLKQILNYVVMEVKTEEHLISTQDCMPESAFDEMQTIKRMYGKDSGRQYIHIVQSFAKDEPVTHEQAHEIGRQLAARFSGFQAVIATHTDCAHVHTHIVLNSVNFETGLKFQQSRAEMQAVKDYSDELCRAQGLSVIEKSEQAIGYRPYAEWAAEQKGNPSFRSIMKADIDDAIVQSLSVKEFIRIMRGKDYEVKTNKDGDLTGFKPLESERFVRLKSLGENYTLDAIADRVSRHSDHVLGSSRSVLQQIENITRQRQAPQKQTRTAHFRGRFKYDAPIVIRLFGLQKLYWRYAYMLGAVYKKKAPQHISTAMRGELVKLEQLLKRMQFLRKTGITTADELRAYMDTHSGKEYASARRMAKKILEDSVERAMKMEALTSLHWQAYRSCQRQLPASSSKANLEARQPQRSRGMER